MGGVYKDGKLVAPVPKKRSRIYLIQGLLGYLYCDLKEFKATIQAEHAKGAIPKILQGLILRYCRAILDCADGYPTSSGRVTKRGKDLVKRLRNDMIKFDEEYSALLPKIRISKQKHKIICELNWAVLWFIKQHDMTISALKVSTPVPAKLTGKDLIDFINKEKIALKATKCSAKIMPYRPRDWELRRFFKKVTSAFKKKYSASKFIQYPKFCKLLATHNARSGSSLTVSARGYYNLKEAWNNQSLDRLV